MQILVPTSSRTSFFPQEEFYFPKPLIEVAGRPMIEHVIRQLKRQIRDAEFTFVIDQEDMRSFSLDRVLKLAAGPDTKIVERLGETSGALCSCLLAVDQLDLDAPLLISNSDQIIDAPLEEHIAKFQSRNADAGVVTFDSVHPRWSYVVDGGRGTVRQAVEKKVVSRHAIAGIYYFKAARDFFEAAKKVILNDVNVGGQFFISATLNEVLLAGGDVLHSAVDVRAYRSFFAPDRIASFERSDLAKRLRRGGPDTRSINVIVPAAGEGSRFAKAGWKKPKPFIDVEGQTMLNHVIDNVTPTMATTTLLLRQAHMEQNPEVVDDFRNQALSIVPVASLTEGTACTVLLARSTFDNDQPMMVANSDQLVDFDVNAFTKDCFDRDLDGSILVFRDPTMDPKWSFAKLNADGLVTEVAEKRPISDLATVGIYLFTRGRDFVSAAADMIAANDRENNEFYTCPVYNYMIRSGARIGVYEVPMDAMSGLGTPDDLNSFLDQRGAAPSADAP